jgi:hypothetical protein
MYIRLKIFNKKSVGNYSKPIFFIEINGENALTILIFKLIEKNFGSYISEKVKNEINLCNEKIKLILAQEGN